MKKLFSIMLALVLVLSMGAVAFADVAEGEIDFGETVKTPYGSTETVEFTYSEDFNFNDYSASIKLGKQYVEKYSIAVVDAAAHTAKLTVKFKGLALAVASEVEVQVKASKAVGSSVTTSSGIAKFELMDEEITPEAIKANVDNALTVKAGTASVITTEGFEAAGSKSLSVQFDGYTIKFVKTTGQKGINFECNTVDIDEIVEKYDDNEFKFLSFTSNVKLANRGILTIDFDEYDEESFGFSSNDDEMVVYLYTYDGTALTYAGKVNLADDDEVKYDLKAGDTLGQYVITNTELSGAAAKPDDTDKETNPNTGVSSSVSAAVALGMIALVSAAAISLKK